MLKKILIVLLILLLAVILIGVLILVGVDVLFSIIIVGASLVALVIFFLLYKLILSIITSRKIKKGASDISDEEGEASKVKKTKNKSSLINILYNFRKEKVYKKLIFLIKKIYYKNHPSGLYKKPWYILLGNRGAGKSSLLRFANISLVAEQEDILINDSEDINFWFTDNATFIDVDGSVLAADDSDSSNKKIYKWKDLLFSLLRCRVLEPINGVIVVVSASDLLRKSSAELEKIGILNRKKINDIIKVFRSPIYVHIVITHIDSVSGMRECCEASEHKLSSLIIGSKNTQKSFRLFISTVIDKCTDSIRGLLFNALGRVHITSLLLKLPVELKGLTPALQGFVRGLFFSNFYKYTPRLQGVYMTGVVDTADGATGAFSHSLLRHQIPSSHVSSSRIDFIERLWLVSLLFFKSKWKLLVLAVFIIVISTSSYNLAELYKYTKLYKNQINSTLDDNAKSMEDLKIAVIKIDDIVNNFWFPWFKLYVPAGFLEKIKDNFYNKFYTLFLEDNDKYYESKLSLLFGNNIKSGNYDSKEILGIAEYATHVVRRIRVLDKIISSNLSLEEIDSVDPVFLNVNGIYKSHLNSESKLLNRQYIYASYWSDIDKLKARASHLKDKLLLLLNFLSRNFMWLTLVTDKQIDTDHLNISNFWSGSKNVADLYKLNGAYTLSGKEFIEKLLSDISKILEKENLSTEVKLFYQDYIRDYFKQWRDFAVSFRDGMKTLGSRGEWMSEISKLSLASNLYFRALSTIRNQLHPFIDEVDESVVIPLWAEMLSYYEYFVLLSDKKTADTKSSFMQKILQSTGRGDGVSGHLLSAMQRGERGSYRMFKKLGKSDNEINSDLKVASKSFNQYLAMLKDISFNIGVRDASYTTVKDIFKNDEDVSLGSSSLAKGYNEVHTVQALTGVVNSANSPFWSLYSGSLELIKRFMLEETLCVVNNLWEEKFLAEIENVPENKVTDFMFSSNGLLWSFIDKHLKDFLVVKRGIGYSIKKVSGYYVNLSSDFLKFVSYGRSKVNIEDKDVSVFVHSMPTNVNLGAMYFPEKTVVSLMCSGKKNDIYNYNYNAKSLLTWNNKCTDVTVSVYVSDLVLQKVYPGRSGLYDFMNAFKDSHLRYPASLFPAQKDELKFMDIKYIDLSYNFSGKQLVQNALNIVPSTPPNKISFCWK